MWGGVAAELRPAGSQQRGYRIRRKVGGMEGWDGEMARSYSQRQLGLCFTKEPASVGDEELGKGRRDDLPLKHDPMTTARDPLLSFKTIIGSSN